MSIQLNRPMTLKLFSNHSKIYTQTPTPVDFKEIFYDFWCSKLIEISSISSQTHKNPSFDLTYPFDYRPKPRDLQKTSFVPPQLPSSMSDRWSFDSIFPSVADSCGAESSWDMPEKSRETPTRGQCCHCWFWRDRWGETTKRREWTRTWRNFSERYSFWLVLIVLRSPWAGGLKRQTKKKNELSSH